MSMWSDFSPIVSRRRASHAKSWYAISPSDVDQVARTAISISALDYARLARIATAGAHTEDAPIAEMLAGELERAHVVAPDAVEPDVVTMHSRLEYKDEVTGDTHRVTIVYPEEEDRQANRVSILSTIGVALIGVSERQPIEWQGPRGGLRGFTVLRLLHQPERDAITDLSMFQIAP